MVDKSIDYTSQKTATTDVRDQIIPRRYIIRIPMYTALLNLLRIGYLINSLTSIHLGPDIANAHLSPSD